MKKYNLIKTFSIGCVLALIGLSLSSCEDDSLPDTGSIADLSPPSGAFAVSDASTSSLIKIFRNTSASATGGTFSFPEGSGEFVSECEARATAGCSDVVSLATDEEVFYRFNEFGDYEIGIEASDDLGVISDLNVVTVPVVTSDAPLATVAFDVDLGISNFERILTNNSANDNGGIEWSATFEGTPITNFADFLVADGDLQGRDQFLGQTVNSDEILVSLNPSGNYEIFLTATNFDGIETTDSQSVTVDPISDPIPEFTISADADYAFYVFDNTTPDSDAVLWTLPGTATFVNGTTDTDDIVNVMFANSGVHNIDLTVTSFALDGDGNTNEFTGTSTVPVNIITSVSEIPTPVLFRGGFEPGDNTNPLDCINRNDVECAPVGAFRTDQGKEWWIADGISERVFLGDIIDESGATVPDPNQELIDTELDNQTWFPGEGFNRLVITSNSRSGDSAVNFDPARPFRVGVQEIEVTPGADYRITYFINNINSIADASVKVFILDPLVENDVQANSLEYRIAGRTTANQDGVYLEESLEFNAGSNTSVKLYFYPTDPTLTSFLLDDVSIAID